MLSRETGITFPASRYTFVANRLATLLDKYKSKSLLDLMSKAKNDDKIKIDMLNVLTTNETWFFRHLEHFEILKKEVIPALLKKRNKVINVWSAGCSIGAEAYSILITLLESIPNSANFRLNILGSDISYNAIQIAREGVYDRRDLRTTPPHLTSKYFDQINADSYKIKAEFKQYVAFEFLNLLKSWPPRDFDIIFCRNTMIYFSDEIKQLLVKRFYRSLELNGYFFASTNEQIDVENTEFGFKKIFLENEYIYQKSIPYSTYCELFFKTASDLLKASNHLRRNSYEYQFGPVTNSKDGTKLRSLIVNTNDCEKIIKFLKFNSITPTKSFCIKE